MVDGIGHKIYAFIAEKENMYDENKRKMKEKNDNINNRYINILTVFLLVKI